MTATARLDWSQWICPGPRRVFSAAELARGGQQPWPAGIDTYVYTNALGLLLIFYNQISRPLAPWVLGGTLASAALALAVARGLWRQPTRRRLNTASLISGLLFALLAAAAIHLGHREQLRAALPYVAGELTLVLTSWWFLTLYRSQQIQARLTELDAQDERLRLAQRLATAQIQPHFLFNTLASLQHWVDTQDGRAGPMLRSLTRYLRATLPLFEQDRLSLAQELQLVQSYLEIMQARLGERLRWTAELPAQLPAVDLPPGALLTLAENAITHGIEPCLRGGQISLRVRQRGQVLRLEVQDDGAGPPAEHRPGLGLSNTLERLRAQHGPHADLGLAPAQPGCLAWLDIPLERQDA